MDNKFDIKGNVLVKYNGADKAVIIPEGVTEIAAGAFKEHPDLISVSIPEGVTKIGASAFERCPKLVAVFLPNSLIEIKRYAFFGCKILSFITTLQERERVMDFRKVDYNQPENVAAIQKTVSQLPLPSHLLNFGEYAFRETLWLECKRASDIERLVIINTVLVDGEQCPKYLKIPLNVHAICTNAFEGAYLLDIDVTQNVVSIEPNAFGTVNVHPQIKVNYKGKKYTKKQLKDLYELFMQK